MPSDSPVPSPAATPSILIVDDDTIICEMLDKKFTEAGFAVTLSHAGGEALMALGDHVFDIVLLDVHLPEFDGVEILRRRADTPNAQTPIVMLTAFPDKQDAAIGLGAVHSLVKSETKPSEIVHEVLQIVPSNDKHSPPPADDLSN